MAASFTRTLTQAARSLRKSPAFAATTVGTIALGIGATTAIFSVLHTVLLRRLPYADPGRLVLVQSDMVSRHVLDFPMPPGDFADLKEQGTLFQDVAAVATFQGPLVGDGGEPEQVNVAPATTNLFSLLGARTVLGRGFLESDGTPLPPPPNLPAGAAAAPAPAPPPATAVLSYAFWQRRYGGDRNIIGRTIQLAGGPAEVVGVLEPGFELLFPPRLNVVTRPDVFVALRIDFASASRINVFLRFVGRLQPGVTVAQAQSQVDGIVRDLRQRFPIKETAGVRWRVEPMQDYLVADVKASIFALMGAVAFVLLIACANVGNLMLVRASVRQHELSVRAALGASRGELIRQTFGESVVVAGVGAVLGVGLAFVGLAVLRAIAPPSLPRIDVVQIDPAVLGFTALAAAASAALFGLVPAVRASRPDAASALRAAGRTAGLAGGRRLRNAVVVVEVALSFVLLVGTGLMIRSFVALNRVNPGFDPAGVLTFVLQPTARNNPDQRAALARDVRERLASLPGVTAVSAATPLPLSGAQANARWGTDEAAADPAKFQQADIHVVLPGYFAAMRTRLLEGRTFTEADNAPDRNVVIIDQLLARQAFPRQSAVGQRLLVRARGDQPEWLNVIGVVEHERHASLARPGPVGMFLADGYFGHGVANTWIIRTNRDPAGLSSAARRALHEAAPTAVVAQVQPYAALLETAMAPTRFALLLIGVFGGIAAVLAAVGLYGVLSTAVRQRTAEIGIRMTFGAQRANIFQLILGQGLRLGVVGIVCGLAAAFFLTPVLGSLLVGVRPTDPVTYAGIAAFFVAVAAVACVAPARRAAGLDPNAALREE
jgi:predicted permease